MVSSSQIYIAMVMPFGAMARSGHPDEEAPLLGAPRVEVELSEMGAGHVFPATTRDERRTATPPDAVAAASTDVAPRRDQLAPAAFSFSPDIDICRVSRGNFRFDERYAVFTLTHSGGDKQTKIRFSRLAEIVKNSFSAEELGGVEWVTNEYGSPRNPLCFKNILVLFFILAIL